MKFSPIHQSKRGIGGVLAVALWLGVSSSALAATTLRSGARLNPGASLRSTDTHTRLIMQGDGNLVLYHDSEVLFHTTTQNHPGAFVIMQTDGNLVVYTPSGIPLWNSMTAGHNGATLALQNDQNLVIYKGTTPLWWTLGLVGAGDDGCPVAAPPGTLFDGADAVGIYEICRRSVADARSPQARGAIKIALVYLLGMDYSQADREGPHSSDCSSFVNRAYRVLIPTISSWSPTTYYMVNEAYHGIDVAGVSYRAVPYLLPGDLGFIADVGHVAMHLAYGFVADHGSGLSKIQKRSDCNFYPTQVLP